MDAAGGAEAPVASLPAGLQELLLRRIEALAPQARRVLEAASVVGEAFAVAAVAAGPRPPWRTSKRCEPGWQRSVTSSTTSGGRCGRMATRGGRYRFQHALYQQVLYEALGTARRVQLHQGIGTRLGGCPELIPVALSDAVYRSCVPIAAIFDLTLAPQRAVSHQHDTLAPEPFKPTG